MTLSRRTFLGSSIVGASALATGRRRPVWAQGAPAAVTSEAARPRLAHGVQSGDVTVDRAIIWSRADRPSRMIVDWATSERMLGAHRVVGPATLAENDFTARVDLGGLPTGQEIFYRVRFQALADERAFSAPVSGRLRTPPAARRTIRFCFSGDEAGQGWGINPEWGGMKMYEVMRKADPDFFIHSGDQIYADGPIKAEVRLDDGSLWKNVVTEAKAHVAQTLADFRGNFAYNLLDDNKRHFTAQVPVLVQWDDHETRNNWYPGQTLGDERYTERSASLLAAYARRAMFEYNPFRIDPVDPERIYRSFSYGPSLEVFMIDERSYRGPNTPNRQAGAPRLTRDLEGHRQRHADQHRRARPQFRRTQGDLRGVGERRRRTAARPRARDRQPARLHQEQRDQERRVGHGRRPLRIGHPLRSRPREIHRLHAVLGIRGGAHQRRHVRTG